MQQMATWITVRRCKTFRFRQIQSIVLVLILQNIGRVIPPEELVNYDSKCHLSEETITTTPTVLPGMFEAASGAPEEPLPTRDLSGRYHNKLTF